MVNKAVEKRMLEIMADIAQVLDKHQVTLEEGFLIAKTLGDMVNQNALEEVVYAQRN